MTAISNVFCRDFIACSCDSFLVKHGSAGLERVDSRAQKLLPVRSRRAAISYWGFAGLTKLKISEVLKQFAGESTASTLEGFAEALRDKLNDIFAKHPGIPRTDRGIGVHLVGYERVDGLDVPELFLISNFKGITYDELYDHLGCSRRSYLTLSEDSGDDAYLKKHGDPKYRRAVWDYLQTGDVICFNNGDPEMFSPVAGAISVAIRNAKRRGARLPGMGWCRELAVSPIATVAQLQKAFFKDQYRLVGGKIQDLVILPDGQMLSDGGLVSEQWSTWARRNLQSSPTKV